MPFPVKVAGEIDNMGVDQMTRIRNVTAVLGPTNTGKTHLAIERMLGHETGMIGLPLRLLAREIYDRVSIRVGPDKVALITGEEKIKPENARYWICTVEAMPQDVTVAFLAIDEIQLAGDPDRGHVFTDRLLHARGTMETLVLGAASMREAIAELIPGANFITRPRLSKLTYAGQKKITRLPTRSAIVAFSAADVYAIAELIRRQRGGAAVVLGALSPRTRNAQVALYQSGDVDFLVATDAIGMGLNLDVDHVSFSSLRKFDGQNYRNLTAAELAQIAGRAGRHMNDGTFGVTGDAEPLAQDLIDRLEDHDFPSVKTLQWRARDLDFRSIDALRDSLRTMPDQPRLVRARGNDDFDALENVSRDPDVLRLARSKEDVEALWDVCQIPDYRKISAQNHAELVANVFKDVRGPTGKIDEDWFAKQVAFSDRTDGDIDTLSNRLAHIRTWTFVANRSDWLRDPGHWQERTRAIEDSLSDALHVCLTQRFIDARASALMKGMKDNPDLSADISDDGSIHVESHFVGSLKGFRYIPDSQAGGLDGKTTRSVAGQVLSREISMRARRVVAAKNDAFSLTRTGKIVWRGDEIAKLDAAEDPLRPQVALIADDSLQGADRERVLLRVQTWITDTIAERLKPLVEISRADDIEGLARGIAFRLAESVGVLKREVVSDEMKALDQAARGQLRRYGVRFGAFNIFIPSLLKPAAADLLLTLWCLRYGKENGLNPDEPPEAPRAGLTSAKVDANIPEAFYRAYGFHVCGPRAVRIDMLERLADLIRPLLSWRARTEGDQPPKGSTGDGGFVVIPEMMSILGCSPEELSSVLAALGFRLERRDAPKVVERPPVAPLDATMEQSQDAPPETNGPIDLSSAQPPASAQQDSSLTPSDVPPEVVDVAMEPVQDGEQQEQSILSSDLPTETELQKAVVADAPDVVTVAVVLEIWRPRRRNDGAAPRRQRGRGRQAGVNPAPEPQAERPSPSAAEPVSPGYVKRDERVDKRRTGSGAPIAAQTRSGAGSGAGRGKPRFSKSEGRREESNRGVTVHSSSPARTKGVDPNSPFAALMALRDSLSKSSGDS